MRILIDAHMVGEKETGNETYITHLIQALRKLPGDIEIVAAVSHPEAAEAKLGGYDQRCRPVMVSSSPWARLGWELSRVCRNEQADILHVTYAGPFGAPCPMVVTIHDVAYKVSPEWFSPRDRMVLSAGIAMTKNRASRIITVSEHARSEIIRHLSVDRARIDVTLEAAAPMFSRLAVPPTAADLLSRFGLRGPYVLAVGNLQPRKNLLRLVEAFASLIQQTPLDHQLVLVGKSQWRESDVHACIHHYKLTDRVVFTGYINDDDLVDLFNAADVFAYPSLYEGFGLPVIEAMACGAPVLTSNVTSIPEVAGDAAILIDPRDTAAIADGLKRMLTDAALRHALREKGLARSASFSWASCARATFASYQAAIG